MYFGASLSHTNRFGACRKKPKDYEHHHPAEPPSHPRPPHPNFTAVRDSMVYLKPFPIIFKQHRLLAKMIASCLLALLQTFMSPADKPVHLVITDKNLV